jgi:hypothetical protein
LERVEISLAMLQPFEMPQNRQQNLWKSLANSRKYLTKFGRKFAKLAVAAALEHVAVAWESSSRAKRRDPGLGFAAAA